MPLLFSSCIHFHEVMKKPSIDDGKRYGRVELESPDHVYRFAEAEQPVALPPLDEWACDKAIRKFGSPEEFLKHERTSALLIVRNDTLLYEHFFNGHGPDDITQIFSVTKPLTASMLALAQEEGRISSFDEPADHYFPIRKRKRKVDDLTLRHLSNMVSGLNHSDYWRILKIIRFYHSIDSDRYMRKVKVYRKPGKKFRYKSMDTQVLGMCLENIFEEDDLIERFTNTYWKPIGPEKPGYFSVDHLDSGNPKYYGGLNVSPRDLAKIGKIFLNNGVFEGERILPESYFETIRDTTLHTGNWGYSMGWYFDEWSPDRDIFYGSGFNGQTLLMNRDNNTIVIRLGEAKKGHEWFHLMAELSTLF